MHHVLAYAHASTSVPPHATKTPGRFLVSYSANLYKTAKLHRLGREVRGKFIHTLHVLLFLKNFG